MQQIKSYNQTIVTSVSSINIEDWNNVVCDRNIYFSIPYLESLEKSMTSEIDFFYSIVYNEENKPVLISVFQLVKFIDKRKGHSKKLIMHFQHDASCKDDFTVNVLVCGNVFSNGENGFLWNNNITQQEAVKEVIKTTELIKKQKETRKKLSVILFKEFWPSSLVYSDLFKDHHYRDFMIDVNMTLKIYEDWQSMDDYMQSLKAKFRTRANSVFKKSKDVFIKCFDKNDIEDNMDRINELFINVSSKSEYNLGKLNAKTFIHWKNSLKDDFVFKGMFLEDKMIGFSTSFMNNKILEANYVGIDYEYNIDYAIYQRLLYGYVEEAISVKAKELHLGRTSELVKSSLGALPVNMKLYAKHKSPITNVLMKPIFNAISPSSFELRKPFKANFSN